MRSFFEKLQERVLLMKTWEVGLLFRL